MAAISPFQRNVSQLLKSSHLALLILLMVTCQSCDGARFLMPSTGLIRTASHHLALTTITQELVQRGHEVTLLIIDNQNVGGFLPDSYTSKITLPNSMTDEELTEATYAVNTRAQLNNKTFMEVIQDPGPWTTFRLHSFGCFELFKNADILEQLQRERFDKLITFPVMELCDIVLAAYLDIPYIVLSGTRRVPAFHEGMLGIPTPVSYVPFSFATPELGDRMTFSQRVKNAVMFYGVHVILEYFAVYRPINQLQRTYGIRPDLTPWQMISRAELCLCHNTWALEYPRPIGPNWIPIPGLTIKEPKPLPEDLETFVQGSGEHGFIVFTLGSTSMALGSAALIDIFSKVFSELPQRVLWRYAGPTPRYVGNNTLISDWLPQNDLLAHPKARMLIYHGGSAGIHEAVHHGVPMLLMPMGGDQPLNCHLVAAKGMGLVLDPNNLNEDEIKTSISTVLNDESYQVNAKRGSGILQDRLASPLDTAVFWIEHVVKYGGDHLRLRSTEMGFIQLNSLDVVAFLVVLFSIIIYIDYIMIRGCYRCVCKRTGKQKSD
ncbi:UDP-glucuronosyltransferase 2C1 [Strongylocentrotus purpuratus]|uniref:Glucuronosyltransferase n=1 Tax=Strongylocentrotus purpuratus TaxID=7668 RepID=A0A7M7GIM0_STRPU|nr:UDP-glucuronosyltransferase 2C1 [Strongylocentrotus purpuratus]